MDMLTLSLSLGGISVTLIIYFFDLRKKINSLLEKNIGVLTATQATALVDIYLDLVKNELRVKIFPFIQEQFPLCVDPRNEPEVKHFVSNTVNEAIVSARQKVSHFKINGGMEFRKLLDDVSPLDTGVIREAKDECLRCFLEVINKKHTSKAKLDVLQSEIYRVAVDASKKSGDTLKHEIRRFYS